MTRLQVAFVIVEHDLSPRASSPPSTIASMIAKTSRIAKMDIRVEILLLFTQLQFSYFI